MADHHGARDYVGIADRYARDVIDGKEVAGELEILACKRYLTDRARETDENGWPYYFDEWHAADPCDFIEKLPHVEGEWQHETLILEPWEIFILVNVFGFRVGFGVREGKRRFIQVYIEVGRKNGKSPLSAGIALYCQNCEDEPGPQVKTAATTGKQARIVFDVAKAMVEKTPQLRAAFDLQPMAHSIVSNHNWGSIQPIHAKAETQDGLNVHCSIIDELHAHKNRKLFDVLKSARGARKNPLLWCITTAGYNLVGVCYQQRTMVVKILNGVLQAEHYFGVIYTLDGEQRDGDGKVTRPADDPFDEAVWRKANPNLGISVDLDEMRAYAQDAQNDPAEEVEFKTKRCNLWLSAGTPWLSIVQWDACGDPELDIEQFKGCPAFVGGDLADRNDCVSLAIVFDADPLLAIFAWHFLPEDIVKAAADRTTDHYLAWAKHGQFELTPGDMTDYSHIEERARDLHERFDVRRLRFDQFGSAQMVSNMSEDGLPADVMTKNARNFTDPAKELEARVQVRKVRHNTDPVLKWMVSNCVVSKGVDGSILPKKEHKDSPNKIDGVDAVLNAISGYLQYREETLSSLYEQGPIY